MLADALGRPLRFVITAGQAGDVTQAPALLEGQLGDALLADKAYDSKTLRGLIAGIGAEAVIPSNRSRETIIPHDAVAYNPGGELAEVRQHRADEAPGAAGRDRARLRLPRLAAMLQLHHRGNPPRHRRLRLTDPEDLRPAVTAREKMEPSQRLRVAPKGG
jgi:hypothetical protein